MSEQQKFEGTPCIGCHFAEYDAKNRQTGCKVGRLDKFVERGDELDIGKLGNKTFYIIKDRLCMMKCTQKWLEANPNIKDVAKEMRRRIALRCEGVILADDEHNVQDIELTVKSLIKQQYPAIKITVILNSDDPKLHPSKMTAFFRKQEREHENLKWQVTHIQDRGPDGEKPSREWCLDHVLDKSDSPFYTVFLAGFVVPSDFLLLIDRAMNDDVEKFCLLQPIDEWNGAFVQTIMHKRLHGNLPMKMGEDNDPEAPIALSIMDKIDFFAKKEKQEAMIRRVDEICPAIRA